MAPHFESLRIGGRATKFLVVALLATMAFTVTYAQYTSTASVTIGSSSTLATVTPTVASFSVVEGETASKSLGTIFTVSDIAPAYDAALKLNLYLLNPHDLASYYSYLLVNVKVEQNGPSADGSAWTEVASTSSYLSLDKGVVELVPGVDFDAAPNNVNADPMYRVVATVTYHNIETTGIVAPSFYLDVAQ